MFSDGTRTLEGANDSELVLFKEDPDGFRIGGLTGKQPQKDNRVLGRREEPCRLSDSS